MRSEGWKIRAAAGLWSRRDATIPFRFARGCSCGHTSLRTHGAADGRSSVGTFLTLQNGSRCFKYDPSVPT